MGTTPYSLRPVSTSPNTSGIDLRERSLALSPKWRLVASWVKVASGPRNDTVKGLSRARQALMISL